MNGCCFPLSRSPYFAQKLKSQRWTGAGFKTWCRFLLYGAAAAWSGDDETCMSTLRSLDVTRA